MTTPPTFQILDGSYAKHGQQLSTAHAKALAENILWSHNERSGVASITYARRSTTKLTTLKGPQLAAAQWVGRGPWRVWIPPLRASVSGASAPRVVLRIACSVVGGDVYLVATSGRAPSFGSVAVTTASPGDTVVAVDLAGVVPGWNDVYLWYRSEADVSSPTSYGVSDRREVSRLESGGPLTWYAESQVYESGSSIPTPNQFFAWLYVAGLGSTAPTADEVDALATVGFSDHTTKYWVIADALPSAPWNGVASGQSAEVWSGPLGTLTLRGVYVDTTQALVTEDENQWAALRWLQLPSSLQLGALAQRVVTASFVRLPQVAAANGELYDVDSAAGNYIGGQWRIGDGGWSTSTEILRHAYWIRQEVTNTLSAAVEVHVPLMLASRFGARETLPTATVRVNLYAEDGTTLEATATASAELTPINPETSLTSRWVCLAQVLDDGTGRRWAMDGCTSPADADAGVWTWVVVNVDCSGLTLDSLAWIAVEVECAARPQDRVAVGDVAIRTTQEAP